MKIIIIFLILFKLVVSEISLPIISQSGSSLCPGILQPLYLKSLSTVDIIGKYNENTTLLFKNIQDDQTKLLSSHTDIGKEVIEKLIKTARTKEKKNFSNCLKNGTQMIIDAMEKIKYEIEECYDNAVIKYEESVAFISDMGINVTNMFKELIVVGKCHNFNIPNVCREWIGPSAQKTVSEFENTVNNLINSNDTFIVELKKKMIDCCGKLINSLKLTIDDAKNKTEACVQKRINKDLKLNGKNNKRHG